jgi:hypothetical protein
MLFMGSEEFPDENEVCLGMFFSLSAFFRIWKNNEETNWRGCFESIQI